MWNKTSYSSFFKKKTPPMCDLPDTPSMTIVAQSDILELLTHFAKNTYKPRDGDQLANVAMQRCLNLFRLDYKVYTINNSTGELSNHYPSQILIMEHENNQNNATNLRTTNTIYESSLEEPKLRDLISKARSARCRARFPVPVILYKSKQICRSATISSGPEIYSRTGLDYFFSTTDGCAPAEPEDEIGSESQSEWAALFSRVRTSDIKLLRALGVGTIADFMVEKKKVKYGVNVTSSEKVDKENRYSEFTLISLPYPGCEFFKDYRDNSYIAKDLVFDWSQTYADASLFIPEEPIVNQLHIDWAAYKSWDLDTITKNYLKLLLKYLQDGNSGLLIHCISGWDRTPLFVSLIRLSLWADGLIHQNLDAQQILYLTIAYDWMLFGHHLPDRLGKGEEIFFFCFNFLKQIKSDEFRLEQPGRKVRAPSDKLVNRTDSESLLDTLMFETDSRGSNISLNSTCSSVSTKSQEYTPTSFGPQEETNYSNGHNGNPVLNLNEPGTSYARSPQSRRTSPVTVPATRLRSRNESSSSVSLGSWQMISTTGSIRDSETDSNGLNANDCSSNTHGSMHTLVDEDTVMSLQIDEYQYRSRRLMKVRELFLKCYHRAIGFKYSNETSLGALLGNIAEKVGLSSRT